MNTHTHRDLLPEFPPIIQWGFQCPTTGIAVEADWDDGFLTLSVNPLDTDTEPEIEQTVAWCGRLSGSYPSYLDAEAALRSQGVEEFRG